MTSVELIVNMDCYGCMKKVRKALENLDGVDNVEIDMDSQKVTVTGWAKQEDILELIRKTGKNVELWPFPYISKYFDFTQQYTNLYPSHTDPTTYFNTEQHNQTTSTYHVNTYNDYEHNSHQELPQSSVVNGKTHFVAFSDENVNACSVM